MLKGLKLLNFQPDEEREQMLLELNNGQVFVLRTCQRTLILGFNKKPEMLLEKVLTFEVDKVPGISALSGVEGYEFLLETICGLKSRILGETEIVNQFKDGYNRFLACETPNRLIQSVLEKLFKDAKDIRSEHLKYLSLQTYAGITRRILSDLKDGRDGGKGKPVLLLGSGELAEDILKISYRKFNFILCARNTDKVNELATKYGAKVLDWNLRDHVASSSFVINTIGTTQPIFKPRTLLAFENYLKIAQNKLFIDLANPSPFETLTSSLDSQKGIFSLEAIFKYGEKISSQNEQKVDHALSAIKERSLHRQAKFSLHLPFGWDELQFA